MLLFPRENAEMSDFLSGKYIELKFMSYVFSEGNRCVIYSLFSVNPSSCYASVLLKKVNDLCSFKFIVIHVSSKLSKRVQQQRTSNNSIEESGLS